MPPHCDAMDGPVVTAAREALAADDVTVVLPFVPADGEVAVRRAFVLARRARAQGEEAREVADLYFFDTVVRVHRRGEGAPHTGLKPAGLDVGPVVPLAEEAASSGDPADLVSLLRSELEEEIYRRTGHVRALARHAHEGVPAARAAVSARLALVVWANRLWETMRAELHGNGHGDDQRRRLAGDREQASP